MTRWLLLLALLLVPAAVRAQDPPAKLFTPASAVAFAWQDVAQRAIANGDSNYIRYVSLYNVPPAERKAYWQAVSFTINSLSKSPLILPPPIVPDTEDSLIRIDLSAYKIDPAQWDRLSELGSGPAPFPEPFFHILLEREVKEPFQKWYAGGWENGKYYGPGNYTYTRTVKRKVLAQPPWLPKQELLGLIAETQTEYPIVRGDWFIASALIEPRYHELLDLPETVAQLEKQLEVDLKQADRRNAQARGAVLYSRVAEHNRILDRTPTIDRYGQGWYWKSIDFKTSILGQDILRDTDGPLIIQGDANEILFVLPNGLQGGYLADGAGKRLDKALADIAIDDQTPLRDKQVWTYRNCAGCHHTGIIPIEDEVRLTATGKIALALEQVKKKDARKAEQIAARYFAVDLAALVRQDAANFSAALLACNGLAGQANSALLMKITAAYIDGPITLDGLSLDTGYPVEVLRGTIERRNDLSHVFVGLIQQPPRPARRDQLEAVYYQIMAALITLPAQGGAP